MNLTNEQLRRNQWEREEAIRRIKVARMLVPMKDANDNEIMVRGVVDQVRCKWCNQPRWNDGTPCKYPTSSTSIKGVEITLPCGCREVITATTETEEPTL